MRIVYHVTLAAVLFTTALNAQGVVQSVKQVPVEQAISIQIPTDASAPGFEQYRLPNGLTVLLVENHSARATAFGVWYSTGSESQRLLQLASLLSFWDTSLQRSTTGRIGDFEVVSCDQLATALRLKASQVKTLVSGADDPSSTAFSATSGTGVSAAALRDLGKFFQDYYALSNATLIVTGNFNRIAIKTLINTYFAPLSSGLQSAIP